MLLVLLVACVRLVEGDYTLDYAPVELDSCAVLAAGQPGLGTTAALSWEAEALVLALDGAEDPLVYAVDGTTLVRESAGRVPLDAECALATTYDERGEMLSGTAFAGGTHITGVLDGACDAWVDAFAAPCVVDLTWEGARVE